MTPWVAALLLLLILVAPLVSTPIERNLELYFLAVGIVAATLSRSWSFRLIAQVLRSPVPITCAVVLAGLIFSRLGRRADAAFDRLRRSLPRPLLTGVSIFLVGLASSLISSIIAGLVLVETIGLLDLGPPARDRVVVAGCFAIGIGSALTPAGGPFSAIVAAGLNLGFGGLIQLLGPWLIGGVVAMSLLSAWFARGDYDLAANATPLRRRMRDTLRQGAKVFAFVAGLALVSAAYAPLALRWVPLIAPSLLYWGNVTSAVLDNAALAAIEIHGIPYPEIKPAVLAMVIAGGILVPGNIPNILCAGILGISSRRWAVVGIPIGLSLMGICFAVWMVHG
ncbi:MAG TPA: DUF1646 family protein [Candidatus Binataceae bacterium]|jgi:predicted cation transporter|nr:DUF1646 family protein [Candidatus Binataceae bacterium]